jgi:hypothetical protein
VLASLGFLAMAVPSHPQAVSLIQAPQTAAVQEASAVFLNIQPLLEAQHLQQQQQPQPQRRLQQLCTGASCQKMSDLLPQLRFKKESFKITCSCPDFFAARCFAPGCFPCDKACFKDQPDLAKDPGPFGTGLLCSQGCKPCCQKEGDPERAKNSTCKLVGDTC